LRRFSGDHLKTGSIHLVLPPAIGREGHRSLGLKDQKH
jgi:hypothetical protein